MRPLTRSYLQHANRHLPEGSDPLPFAMPGDIPTPFTSSYVIFERAYTGVAASTPQTFDLSTAGSVGSNEGTPSIGTSWTGTNFAYDTSDPNYLHILTTGVYVYEATVWLGDGTSTPSGALTCVIEETGSLFSVGAAGANGKTFNYIDPSLDSANVTAYRQRTYSFQTGSTFPGKRGITFTHNNPGGALDVLVTMVVFRIAPAV